MYFKIAFGETIQNSVQLRRHIYAVKWDVPACLEYWLLDMKIYFYRKGNSTESHEMKATGDKDCVTKREKKSNKKRFNEFDKVNY